MSRPRRRLTLSDVATALLVACAAVTALLAAARMRAPPPSFLPNSTVEGPPLHPDDGRRLGSADAPIQIIMFSDFECPFCAHAHRALGELRQRHPTQVAVVYRHFTLSSHRHARRAALAAECAGRQGRFEAYADGLFEQQDSIGSVPWETLAERAGVTDLPRFERCLEEREGESTVQRDQRDGVRIGVTGTPTFVIGDDVYVGSVDASVWEQRLRALGYPLNGG